MRYAWQRPGWPRFEFDRPSLNSLELQFVRNEGALLGFSDALDAHSIGMHALEAIADEALATSLIEAEILQREDVRSSIRNRLGMMPNRPASAKADGVVAMLLDVRKHSGTAISHEDLFRWQEQVMAGSAPFGAQIETGRYRTSAQPMVILSGRIGNETVHYEAPPADQVHQLMSDYLEWLNSDTASKLPALTRAGIAHIWFEQIHPFEDGNGRVGRAIAEHTLSRGSPRGVLPISLSEAINTERSRYYEHLNACNYSANITDYLHWFGGVCIKAQETTLSRFRLTAAKAVYWQRHSDQVTDANQIAAINKIFDAGKDGFTDGISSSKFAALAKVSRATATRYLSELSTTGVLIRLAGGGRSTRYVPSSVELIKELGLTPDPLQFANLALDNEPLGPTTRTLARAVSDVEDFLAASPSLAPADAALLNSIQVRMKALHGKLFNGRDASEIDFQSSLSAGKSNSPNNDFSIY